MERNIDKTAWKILREKAKKPYTLSFTAIVMEEFQRYCEEIKDERGRSASVSAIIEEWMVDALRIRKRRIKRK